MLTLRPHRAMRALLPPIVALTIVIGSVGFVSVQSEGRTLRIAIRMAPWRRRSAALDAGCSDISSFNRVFRARFGDAPSEVRALCRRPLPSIRLQMQLRDKPSKRPSVGLAEELAGSN